MAASSERMAGCSSFVDNVCKECARDYFLNGFNVCVLVDTNCKSFNRNNGLCKECFPGWVLVEGVCNLEPAKALDPNCKRFNGTIC